MWTRYSITIYGMIYMSYILQWLVKVCPTTIIVLVCYAEVRGCIIINQLLNHPKCTSIIFFNNQSYLQHRSYSIIKLSNSLDLYYYM